MFRKMLLSVLLCSPVLLHGADGGFLFVTFNSEKTPMGEQIYFGLSKDGRDWEALNNAQPVLVSELGEKGVRDPYILRDHDGKKFHIIATDLSINLHHGWDRATKRGSKSIIIWESEDLIHWSAPWSVQVAPDDAGCTWAPEATYDENTQDYLVFWASMTGSDNFAKQRIWAARTKDFKIFSKPFIYIEAPYAVIDTDIVRDNGHYYRFTKNEQFKAVTMEMSDKLDGPWSFVPGYTLSKMQGFEGPCCFQLEPAQNGKPATWCLLLDNYAKHDGYKAFTTTDLSSGNFVPATDFKFPFKFRHGTVLPLTEAEYQTVKAAYSK